MISYIEALSRIMEQGRKRLLGTETVSLDRICGRVCAEKVRAPRANQPFDNSAMDGFAVRSEDIQNAVNDNPVTLEMIGHIAAGGLPAASALAKGQCYEIMTGAPVPLGTDAIVPVEKIQKKDKSCIIFSSSVSVGENIRLAGSDFSIGDSVVETCTVLGTGHVLALATLGIGKVKVVCKPKVAFVSTGLEVVDDPDAVLKEGQIYNSTGPYLSAALSQMGAAQLSLGSVGDSAAMFKDKINEATAAGCDVILSTGAVSAGAHDFVPAALKELGAEVFFHKVAMRPGKPIFFARLPNGGPFFVGLPGNPVSTAAGLRFFVQPLLRAMQGLLPEQPCKGMLAKDFLEKKQGLCFFQRGKSYTDETGMLTVDIIPNQQSFKVSPFVKSDVWVLIPEEAWQLKAGEVVEIYQ